MNTPRLRLAVLDLAGTLIVPEGPVVLFKEAFNSVAFTCSHQEIKRYMGLSKIDTIRKIVADKYKNQPEEQTENLSKKIYAHLLELAPKVLTDYSTVIPEALKGVHLLRSRGWLITATTGYPKVIGDKVRKEMLRQGLSLDHLVCSDEVDYPRPHPEGIYSIFRWLGYPEFERVLKAGDTPADIQEGRKARVDQTIGLTKYSLTPEELHEADQLYPTLYELAQEE